VVVYDDRSTDGTAEVVKTRASTDARLTLISGQVDPKEGHYGKAATLHRGITQLRAAGMVVDDDLILFLDADVILEPGTLAGVVAPILADECDVVSGGPRVVCGSMAESLLLPGLLSAVASRHPPSRVHNKKSQVAFLNGQLITLSASTLAKADDFASVQNAILEDVALAHTLKGEGARLGLLDLRAGAATRMYRSYAEIRAGFGKNLVPLMGGILPTLALALLGPLLPLLPWAALFLAVVAESLFVGIIALAALALVVQIQIAIRRMWSAPLWPAPLSFLSGLLVADLAFSVALKTLVGGEVTWRGRSYKASTR
jgi:hypothetical protein